MSMKNARLCVMFCIVEVGGMNGVLTLSIKRPLTADGPTNNLSAQ